ncbi:hypothetical protein GNI_030620, partial [Gregarina niphandrodes]
MFGALLLLPFLSAGVRQINPVSALLPFTSVPEHRVNLTLRAYDGCYRWRVQRPNAVLIRDLREAEIADLSDPGLVVPDKRYLSPRGEVDGGACHDAVVVSSVLPASWTGPKERSWVFADDGNAGVKAEVYVAKVARLEVETTAKAVAVGSAETLRVKAFDAEGNVFSSLEGLLFAWEAEAVAGGGRAISLGSLSDDVYRPSAVRRAMAERRQQSDVILIKGLESGRAVVHVKLLEPGYEHVRPTSVWIDVVEPFAVTPSDLAVPPGAAFRTAVRLLREGSKTAGHERHFEWSSADPALLETSARGQVIAAAEKTGETRLLVKDSRNHNNTDFVSIRVQPPARIVPYHAHLAAMNPQLDPLVNGDPLAGGGNGGAFEQLTESQFFPAAVAPSHRDSLLNRFRNAGTENPHDTWYLAANDTHLVTLDLRSPTESLFVPANVRFSHTLSRDVPTDDRKGFIGEDDIKPVWRSANGATIAFRATGAVGSKGTITFALDPNEKGKTAVKISKTVNYEVVAPLGVQGLTRMKYVQGELGSTVPVTLPFGAQTILTPFGGTGVFKATSSDSAVCDVTMRQQQIVLSAGRKAGIATVTVRDELYPAHFYKFHCNVGAVASIYVDGKQRLPVRTGRPEVMVPISARTRNKRLALWASDAPERRSVEELAALPASKSVDNFWTCGELELAFHPGATIHYRASPSPMLRMAKSDDRYICTFGVLQAPLQPGRVSLETQVAGPNQEKLFSSRGHIEFYAELDVKIPEEVRFPKYPPSTDVSSSRIEQSQALIIGGSIVIELVGGPEYVSGCSRSLTYSAPPGMSIVPEGGGSYDSADILMIDGKPSRFRIQCLDELGAFPVEFEFSQICNEDDKLTSTATLYLGCSIPERMMVLPEESELELLPSQPSKKLPVYKSSGPNASLMRGATVSPQRRVNAIVGMQHRLYGVPYDKYGRPLMGSAHAWRHSWVWLNDAGAGSWQLLKPDSVAVTLPNQLDRDHFIAAILTWTGDFTEAAYQVTKATGTAKVQAQKADRLKKSARELTARIRKLSWINGQGIIGTLELHGLPAIALDPPRLEDPILHNPEWAYVVKAEGISSNGVYKMTPGSWLNVLAVSQEPLTLPALQRVANVNKIVPLYDSAAAVSTSGSASGSVAWDSDASVLDVAGKSGRKLFGKAGAYVYLHGSKTRVAAEGEVFRSELHVSDPSLLGPKTLRLELESDMLQGTRLELRDRRSGVVVAEEHGQNELEKGLDYEVRVRSVGRLSGRALHPSVNRAFALQLVATPTKYFYVAGDRVRGLARGKGLLEGRLGGGLGNTAPLSVTIDDAFEVQPTALVLLPGGARWRPQVRGGGSVAREWALVSDNSRVVGFEHDNHQTLVSGAVGKAAAKLIREVDVDKGLAAPALAALPAQIAVTVAHPHHVALQAGDKLLGQKGGFLYAPKDARVPLGLNLYTSDGAMFTRPALVLGSGNGSANGGGTEGGTQTDSKTAAHKSGAATQCVFKWHALNPDLLAFVAHSDGSRKTTLQSTVEGRLDVEVVGLKTGQGKVLVTVDCGSAQHWLGTFKSSASLTVEVGPPAPGVLGLGERVESDGEV